MMVLGVVSLRTTYRILTLGSYGNSNICFTNQLTALLRVTPPPPPPILALTRPASPSRRPRRDLTLPHIGESPLLPLSDETVRELHAELSKLCDAQQEFVIFEQILHMQLHLRGLVNPLPAVGARAEVQASPRVDAIRRAWQCGRCTQSVISLDAAGEGGLKEGFEEGRPDWTRRSWWVLALGGRHRVSWNVS